MAKTLALDKDGNLSYCSVPEDMRGTNGCPHVGHMNQGESTKDFIERVSKPYVEPEVDDTWDKLQGGGAMRQREDGYMDFKHPDGRYEVTTVETAGEMAAEYEETDE